MTARAGHCPGTAPARPVSPAPPAIGPVAPAPGRKDARHRPQCPSNAHRAWTTWPRPSRCRRPPSSGRSMTKAQPITWTAQPLDQLEPGRRSAAGGQQVIHQQNLFARLQRVVMHLHHGGAIFQRVGLAERPPRQLALLADRHEARRQLVRHRAAQDEAPRLKAHHLVDALAGIGVEELVDRHAKAARIAEQRGHVAEHDAGLRKVGDGADIVLDGFHGVPHQPMSGFAIMSQKTPTSASTRPALAGGSAAASCSAVSGHHCGPVCRWACRPRTGREMQAAQGPWPPGCRFASLGLPLVGGAQHGPNRLIAVDHRARPGGPPHATLCTTGPGPHPMLTGSASAIRSRPGAPAG